MKAEARENRMPKVRPTIQDLLSVRKCEKANSARRGRGRDAGRFEIACKQYLPVNIGQEAEEEEESKADNLISCLSQM